MAPRRVRAGGRFSRNTADHSAMSLEMFRAAGALAGGNPRRADKTAGEGAGGTEKSCRVGAADRFLRKAADRSAMRLGIFRGTALPGGVFVPKTAVGHRAEARCHEKLPGSMRTLHRISHPDTTPCFRGLPGGNSFAGLLRDSDLKFLDLPGCELPGVKLLLVWRHVDGLAIQCLHCRILLAKFQRDLCRIRLFRRQQKDHLPATAIEERSVDAVRRRREAALGRHQVRLDPASVGADMLA